MADMDNLLGASVNMYQALKGATVLFSDSPSNQDLKSSQQQLLKNLIDSLELTTSQLAQEIDEERVSMIDSLTLDFLEQACDEMEIEGATESKIKVLSIGVFGLEEPLGPVLWELRKLLRVARSLKRGERVEKVQRAKKGKNDENRERK